MRRLSMIGIAVAMGAAVAVLTPQAALATPPDTGSWAGVDHCRS